MATRRRTGQPQKAKQAFHVDRLPPHVREAIELLKNHYGKTYEEIEALSAEPMPKKASEVPLGGFMDWEKLDTEVLALFPNRRIPKSNLQRWYDVRVAQVKSDVMRRSAQARELAQAFAGAVVEDGEEAVVNACRDTIMGVLAENSSASGRQQAAGALLKLAQVQQKAKALKLLERKVSVDEQSLQMKIDEMTRKAQKLVSTVEGAPGVAVPMTRAELISEIKGIYGIPR